MCCIGIGEVVGGLIRLGLWLRITFVGLFMMMMVVVVLGNLSQLVAVATEESAETKFTEIDGNRNYLNYYFLREIHLLSHQCHQNIKW